MRNVLIVTRANYPIGSWSNRVRLLAKGFMASGLNCKVLSTFPWATKDNVANSEGFVEFITKPREKKENLISVVQQLQNLKLLKNRLDEIEVKPDIILLTGDRFLDTYVVSNYCSKNGIKLYLDIVDEVGRAYDSGKKTLYSRLAILNRKGFNLLLKRIDKIFVLSSVLEEKYIKLTGDRNKVKRSSPTIVDQKGFNELAENFSISDELIDLEKNSNKITLTYAGSCVRTNGIFFFLKAVQEVKKLTSLPFRVVFVFHIGNVTKVRDYIEELKIEDLVEIYNGVHPRYIPSLYKESNILVLPEHGFDVANAGFPGKTGEYLISGKAIIATKFSDLSTYLKNGKNAMISEIGDLETYKTNLLQLIENDKLRMSLGQNAKTTGIRYFDFLQAAQIYLK